MYESDREWESRRNLDDAKGKLEYAQKDLDVAGSAQNNAGSTYFPGSSSSGSAPGIPNIPGSGAAIAFLVFWPFYFWREIIFLTALIVPVFWFSQQGAIQYFYHFKSIALAYTYMFGGLALGLAVGLLIARFFKFRLFRILFMLLIATPLLFQMEMAAFSVRATKVATFTKTLTKDQLAKDFLGNNTVNSTFSPAVLFLLKPQQKLQTAWDHELTLPELHPGDHTNSKYQQLWLSTYLATNVPPVDLRNPALAKTTPNPKISARIESDPWPTWPEKYQKSMTTEGLIALGKKYGMLFLYFLPAIAAFWYPKKGRLKVLLINTFLGWTIIGWFWAGILAKKAKIETKPVFI